MGSWFSNLHIRRRNTVTGQTVMEFLDQWMKEQGYLTVSADEADGTIAIVEYENGQWISIYSDLMSFEDPTQYAKIGVPLSERFHSDVLGISCFDSDYLYLNLLNTAEQTDAWIGIGSAAGLGIKRRSGLSQWKKKVLDFATFSEVAKKKYTCAEEFLAVAEPCLGLPEAQSASSYEYLEDFKLNKIAQYHYYKLPAEMQTKEPTKLVPYMYNMMPCYIGKYSAVSAINVGEGSRGLSVYFVGPYVENEEITFTNVCLVKHKGGCTEDTPIELTKVQLGNGEWAYYYHDPGFRIPPKVSDQLPPSKQMRAQLDNAIAVRFVPQGNPRKVLDITVVLAPDKYPQNNTAWNVWRPFGSKEAFIKHHNEGKRWWIDNGMGHVVTLLSEEDFDDVSEDTIKYMRENP